MLLVALAVFTLGSLACSAAQTMPQLIGARVLQGLGGGGLMSLSQALIGELVPPVERVRFQGYFALMFSAASIGGPVIGGLVVSHVSWRWLFLANLPLAAFAAWRLRRLPAGERHPRAGRNRCAGPRAFCRRRGERFSGSLRADTASRGHPLSVSPSLRQPWPR